MANHVSSEKRARQEKKRKSVNKKKVATARTAVKSVREAITSLDKKKALEGLKLVQSKLMKVAKSPAMSKKAASRKISRLTKQVQALKA